MARSRFVPNLPAAPSTLPDPRLARVLWQWLALGLLVTLAWPAARGQHWLLGALWLWLLAAPAAALATLYRHALASAWRVVLVHAPRRRRRTGSQARRRPGPGLRRPLPLRAA